MFFFNQSPSKAQGKRRKQLDGWGKETTQKKEVLFGEKEGGEKESGMVHALSWSSFETNPSMYRSVVSRCTLEGLWNMPHNPDDVADLGVTVKSQMNSTESPQDNVELLIAMLFVSRSSWCFSW